MCIGQAHLHLHVLEALLQVLLCKYVQVRCAGTLLLGQRLQEPYAFWS
jgi:hypothetical protein